MDNILFVLFGFDWKYRFFDMDKPISFPFFRYFFKYITYLGDGLAALLVLILLLVIRLDYGLISAIGFTLSALTTQTLKRFVFGEVPRPFLVFKEQIDIGQWHLIDGVEMHQFYSFPSGHTTSIFSICILLSLISKPKNIIMSFL